MYTCAERSTFKHLKTYGFISSSDTYGGRDTADIVSITNEHRGGTSVHRFMPKLKKASLKRLYLDARSGSIDSMSTISMLYLVGFGVDRDETKATTWMNFSLLEPASVSFDEALSDLRTDIKEFTFRDTGDDYVYPESRNQLALSINQSLGHETLHLDSIKSKLKNNNPFLSLTPVLAGVRCTFIYRVSDNEHEDCHLYDAFIDGAEGTNVFTLDVMSKLRIPNMLGELRRKQTVIHYPKRMGVSEQCRYFAVRGVLAVPTSKKHELRARFPELSTVRDLVGELIRSADERRVSFIPSDEEIKALTAEGAALKHRAAQYKQAGKRIPKKIKTAFASVKESIAAVREQDAARKFHSSHLYPENYLDFLALEIVGVSESGGVFRMNVKPTFQSTHLQSLGFKTLSHPAASIESAGCTLTELSGKKLHALTEELHLLYKSEYRIGGILIQPNDSTNLQTAKKRRRYLYSVGK